MKKIILTVIYLTTVLLFENVFANNVTEYKVGQKLHCVAMDYLNPDYMLTDTRSIDILPGGVLAPRLFAESSTVGKTSSLGITFLVEFIRNEGTLGVTPAYLAISIFNQGEDSDNDNYLGFFKALAPFPGKQDQANLSGETMGLVTNVLVKNRDNKQILIRCNIRTD